MSVDEAQRNRIYNKLGELLGPDDAGGLMELLPRHASSELATREDVLATATMLRGEMAELRSELRGEMTELRTDLKNDISELRGEMSAMESRILAEFTSKTHQMLLATLMAVLATAAVVFGAAAYWAPA